MTSKKLVPRAHKRYRVKDGTFAVLFQDSSKLGHLIDICADGFSFCFSESPFIDSDRDGQALLYSGRQDLLEGFSEFDIFLVDSGIYLERMPCKIISEVELDEDSSSAAVSMKRASIQFEDLAPQQVSDLAYFIKHCTEEPV